jgi:RNA polymerase sigma factor (sigma-70 family)
MTPDSKLLRRFAKTNSQDAFAELVKRHVNLVYSTALRKMNGDEHLAKDVAQTVFADLARKADSLSRHKNLTGWLYTSAHFAAAKIVRGENRRRDREEKFMREPIHETAPETDWEKICPALDDAMHKLKESDRDAILFRYFENRPFAEVGAKLGLNENAARMRVERALEKLRAIFAKRGITTATTFATVISANAIQIAPANLAAMLTTASIATAGTGTFTFLKIMTATKIKLAVSAIIVAGAATAFVVQQQTQNKLRAENESLTQQLAQLQTDNENFSNRVAEIGDAKSLSDDQFNELLKLRGEIGVLRQETNQLENLREENRQFHAQIATTQNQSSQLSAQDKYTLYHTHAIDAMATLGVAMQDYARNHNGRFPANFNQLKVSATIATNLPGDFQLDDFEFVNAGLVNTTMPDKLILRQ